VDDIRFKSGLQRAERLSKENILLGAGIKGAYKGNDVRLFGIQEY